MTLVQGSVFAMFGKMKSSINQTKHGQEEGDVHDGSASTYL